MTVIPLRDLHQEMPSVQGCTMGFVDSATDCDEAIRALNVAGIPDSMIMVLTGDDGILLLGRMMGSSLWGEAAEDFLKQGEAEMRLGHFTLIVESQDRDEAIVAANIVTKHGGHGFSHFGLLTDERLTR